MLKTIVIINMNSGNVPMLFAHFSDKTAIEVRREYEERGNASCLMDLIEISQAELRHDWHGRLSDLIAQLEMSNQEEMHKLRSLIGDVYAAGMRSGNRG